MPLLASSRRPFPAAEVKIFTSFPSAMFCGNDCEDVEKEEILDDDDDDGGDDDDDDNDDDAVETAFVVAAKSEPLMSGSDEILTDVVRNFIEEGFLGRESLSTPPSSSSLLSCCNVGD